ncbi:haloacid dehalogenase type II [Cupriavidus lacunae]|uniref:(S)-2-haloacid dehalogenase n=1 Tax=Cupriavidus lacunae TaxID=2666307 RepID=A0A370NPI3_9BURK|nr:haloacid dehalogenase type II [Cupriavidus lacunae]RDK07522.1 haloacid dehalogenase type II [Cupriavidus lacunae]
MKLPKALAFDVFGTVVDWRTGIAEQAAAFLARYMPGTDPGAFADDWRNLYQPAMEECRSGRRPFRLLDALHLETLVQLLERRGIGTAAIGEGELLDLAYAWRRLRPWPDVPPGLAQLRKLFPVVTLSNANIALMIAMNRFNGLEWDAILGAEVSRSYKPTPQAYLASAAALCLDPQDLCLVACHHSDLAAARACGLQTAYVDRPMEYGGARAPDGSYEQAWEWRAGDLLELVRVFTSH